MSLLVAMGNDLSSAIEAARAILSAEGKVVETENWQGIKAPQPFWEFQNLILHAPMPESRTGAINECIPNLPWADEHFRERIGGLPLNPGKSYLSWPFYGRDSKMRKERFTHTYMERFWPKIAGKTTDEMLLSPHIPTEHGTINDNRGIRYDLGDLDDLIHLLMRDPYTRQAYLPIWFPEDTGANHGGRVPCSLGYLFMIREGEIHCTYHIRSCDFLRHFRDDVYHATLLAQYIRKRLQESILYHDKGLFENLQMGNLTMHITSLHIFHMELPRISNRTE